MHRITQQEIDDLESEGQSSWMIERLKQWLIDSQEADRLVPVIEAAFANVKLRNGVGLFEAQGIDDYAGDEERARLRATDEKDDWRRIAANDLNRCYSSPFFFDAAGYHFHLPAFVCAELRGTHDYDFLGTMMRHRLGDDELLNLLSAAQRSALVACLELQRKSPECDELHAQVDQAIEKLRAPS